VLATSKVIVSAAIRAGSRTSALTVIGNRQVVATATKAMSRIAARAVGRPGVGRLVAGPAVQAMGRLSRATLARRQQ
jgi:hypothetical protein